MSLRPTACITGILCALFLFGCANQDNGPAKPDSTAFEWAMDQDIRFNTLIDECEKFDSGLIKSGQQLRSQWIKEYWGAINAANYQYNQQQAAKIHSYNNEKISLPAAKFMVEHKTAALRELYAQKRLPEKQAAYCQLRMAAYEKKEDGMGVALHKNKLQYLNELAQKAPAMAPRAVPSLAGSLQPSVAGPSFYEIERQATNKQCKNPHVLTFLNENHLELYGVYCSGSAGYFVSCEWSTCGVID